MRGEGLGPGGSAAVKALFKPQLRPHAAVLPQDARPAWSVMVSASESVLR